MTQRNSVCSRIRNAKASLDNAEKSFRDNQEVRGELDLMLAEAELQNLRQKRPAWVAWTRRSFAALSALVIVAAGGIGWWWSSARSAGRSGAAGVQATQAVTTVAPAAAQKNREQAVAGQASGSGTAAAGQKAGVSAAATEQAAQPAESAKAARPAAGSQGGSRVRLSSSAMRQLIRSGKQELGNGR